MDFCSFLDKMSEETGTSLKMPDAQKIKENHEKKEVKRVEEKKEERNEKKEVKTSHKKREEKNEEKEEMITEDDAVEKILETTSIIMKTIRQSFPDKKIRKYAYESLQNAIRISLGEEKVQTELKFSPEPKLIPKKSDFITEEEYNKMDFSAVDNKPLPIRMNPSLLKEAGTQEEDNFNEYSRSLSIQPGQGLEGVSGRDIYELQVLSGIKQASR